jgi:hypothetical protein
MDLRSQTSGILASGILASGILASGILASEILASKTARKTTRHGGMRLSRLAAMPCPPRQLVFLRRGLRKTQALPNNHALN